MGTPASGTSRLGPHEVPGEHGGARTSAAAADDADPEAAASPTAKKLHQRHSVGAGTAAAAAKVCDALLPTALRGRRRRQQAACGAVTLLVLLMCAFGRPPPQGTAVSLPGEEQAPAKSVSPPPATGLLQPAEAIAEVLVEFTAPGLYLPLSSALDLRLQPHTEEASLLAALPLGDPAPPEVVAFGGRPSLAQVLAERRRQQQQQRQRTFSRDASPLVRDGLNQFSGSQPPVEGGSSDGRTGSSASADLANAIQAELQQEAEAALRARREQAEKQQAAAAEPNPRGAREEGGATQSTEGRHPLAQQPGSGDSDSGEAGSVRMLVGVVSACCSDIALNRRQAIRDTWALSVAEHENVDLRFFLAQPAAPELAAAWLPRLQEEAATHNDTVVLRGTDTYANLPNKTLRLMRYAVAHPAGYTHVLKTDDDSYVRVSKVLEALRFDASTPPGTIRRRLPGLHQALLLQTARDGSPLHTDGISLWNASQLVASAGAMADRKFLDGADGQPVSLAQLASKAAAEARQSKAQVVGGTPDAANQLQPAVAPALPPPAMHGVYLGCMENRGGFFPIRDASSKWYMPERELPDEVVPFAVKYLAGWGYVLSRDLADHAVRKANLFQSQPEAAPAWFEPMHWEDVLMGLLLMDVVGSPQDHPGFRAAWRNCPAATVVKHLDVDAPQLFKGLHEQDLSGLWDAKPVQCDSGDFLPGDYSSWKAWRDSLATVAHI
ncbi:hypothetical protein D9Q98_000257 [Chlorella vulgaris]|uniref:Uncharacterized protein n=1 Tax=Chlorella vulgaris TaxID=3077 RepID=A0A9D4TXT2_CHLVU|nr:hypothetical protein D9Q98_000257 [Chlorella vulgaris]